MDGFIDLMNLIISFVKAEFVIGGYSFSFWHVIILICLSSIVGFFLRKIFE